MIIKYLRDTLFVSNGISFENKGEYTIGDAEGKELIDTFVWYFQEVKEPIKAEVKEDSKKLAKK